MDLLWNFSVFLSPFQLCFTNDTELAASKVLVVISGDRPIAAAAIVTLAYFIQHPPPLIANYIYFINTPTMDKLSQPQDMEDTEQPLSDCCICRDKLINAVQLDCGHIFCHMCIKSVAETTGLCPLCREEIGGDFNFKDHQLLGLVKIPPAHDGFYWFYEGAKGWWLYDAEAAKKLQQAHEQGCSSVELFIAGHVYLIDLSKMEQKPKDNEGRTRKICRSTTELENVIGLAGIKGRYFAELWDMMKTAGQMEIFARR